MIQAARIVVAEVLLVDSRKCNIMEFTKVKINGGKVDYKQTEKEKGCKKSMTNAGH